MNAHQIHVMLNTEVWEVTLNGDSERRFDTQYEASSFARHFAYQIGGARIIVHGPDGRVLEQYDIDGDEPRDTPS